MIPLNTLIKLKRQKNQKLLLIRLLFPKKKIQIPYVIYDYRQNKNCVDLHDQMMELIDYDHPSYKWTKVLYINLLKSMLVNCWVIGNNSIVGGVHKTMGIIDFLHDMAKEMAPFSIRIRPLNGSINHRYDSISHWPVSMKVQKNCVYCLESKLYSKSNVYCDKCCKFLHLKCFKAYHIQPVIRPESSCV